MRIFNLIYVLFVLISSNQMFAYSLELDKKSEPRDLSKIVTVAGGAALTYALVATAPKSTRARFGRAVAGAGLTLLLYSLIDDNKFSFFSYKPTPLSTFELSSAGQFHFSWNF
jgi:hypothetical protein